MEPPKASDPYRLIVFPEPNTTDTQALTKLAPVIFLGTVTDIAPAQWSTSDGQRPKNPFDQNMADYIYTAVRINVVQTFKGQLENTVELRVGTGTVGQDSVVLQPEDQFTFKTGQRVLVFSNEGVQKLNGAILSYYDRYIVTSDGLAQNSYQTLPVETLLKNIEQGVAMPSSTTTPEITN